MTPVRGALAVLALAVTTLAAPAHAHPHVFIDGGVDFVFGEGRTLEALNVTWLYDAFETLYILSSLDIVPDDDWTLSDEDRAKIEAEENAWAPDFKGASHLKVAGQNIDLSRPKGLRARLVEDRLLVTFRRDLARPVDLSGSAAEVAFYESTYFYAFAATHPPDVVGGSGDCTTHVTPFDADTQLAGVQKTLATLGREETPSIDDVGALFADRIAISCE
ncbi:ABC-type uncharacterized transport system, periplasmic component (plasmid) [Paracoccaceae bacterium]|nr:ABC-type uncharacterized transport system, periplasmic component [Paracoccaceae bacterium]